MKGRAKIPFEYVSHEGEVLLRVGLVQAPLGAQPRQVLGAWVGARLGIQPGGVSTSYPYQAEDGDADNEEGNDAVKDAAQDELSHFSLPSSPGPKLREELFRGGLAAWIPLSVRASRAR